MIPLFELEPHREAEDDPRWKARIKARNIILISAALIVPMGALMIMVALLLGDLDMDAPRPDIVMITAMVHPFLAAFAALGGSLCTWHWTLLVGGRNCHGHAGGKFRCFCGFHSPLANWLIYAVAFSTDTMVHAYGKARRWIQGALGMFFTFAGSKLLLSDN